MKNGFQLLFLISVILVSNILCSSETNNLKSNSKSETSSKNKNNLRQPNSMMPMPMPTGMANDPCPCASQMPACCTPEFESFVCNCIAKPFCGFCPPENLNSYSTFHDSMLKLAMKDAYNQQDMAHKAKLQVELFQKAQEFAKEVGIQEMKAKQYAKILNESTRKAQLSRAMMFQAASQVRLLADRTLRAITPINCNGPHCAGGMLNKAVLSQPTPNFMPSPSGELVLGPVQGGVESSLLTMRQKLNNLGDMNNPVVSNYGSYGNGENKDLVSMYFKKGNNYNGNSRETSYAPSGQGNGY
jgi:hypothetical protein